MKTPMLACKAALTDVKVGMIASPKVDGVRAINLDGILQTRSGKPIANKYVQELFSKQQFAGFDGELTVGAPNAPDVCRVTVAALALHAGKTPATWWIFDDFTNPQLPYATRYLSVRNRVLALNHPLIKLLPIDVIDTVNNSAMFCHAKYIAQGYEGMCARDMGKPYKFGRSTLKESGLLKIKAFNDAEALVVDCVELQRENGERGHCLGALICRDIKTDAQFSVGTGFTKQQRYDYWRNANELIGKTITYRYFDYGIKDAPRFPVFHCFRVDLN